MPFDGAGNFTRAYNFVADKLALLKIQASRVDGEFDNYATAMNAVLLRNGVAPMTGDLKLGANKITGIGAGLVGAPSISFSDYTDTGFFIPSAGVIAASVGGVERFRFHSLGASITNGFLGINTATPRTALDVVSGISSFEGAFEKVVITASALNGTQQLDYKTQAVFVFDSNAAGNFTFNVRGDAGTSLDSILAVNQALTLTVEVPQGVTPYYCTSITVDGAVPSQLKWFSGAPTAGNASGIDIYSITVIKKAAATFYVRASILQAR